MTSPPHPLTHHPLRGYPPLHPPTLRLPHGELRLPLFLPDATQGVVRSVDSADLERCGIQAVVMNTFHLMQRPGSSTVQALGGLHRMCGWQRPIITDSGGFQAYSLIRQNARYGQINDGGILFRPEGSDRKLQLTPEKSVQLQLRFGADVVICLDDCTHVDDSMAAQETAVRRTVAWARRCKAEFSRIVGQKRLSEAERPLLFAVIQGGGSLDLRRQCAEVLLEIGFDGYGYGGWPLDAEGSLLTELLAYTRSLIPPELPMHALGVGHPANVVACARMGYGIFDSAMPTRDARHGRLYAFREVFGARCSVFGVRSDFEDPTPNTLTDGPWLSYLYVGDDKYIKDGRPLSCFCGAVAEPDYSLGYLHHLFKINDSLFLRLATMHNLRFMSRLTDLLRDPSDG
jgi:queuine tRNA-ribosyltransferase